MNMKLTKLDWIADAPGSDPTARLTAWAAINGQPFRLVAHRVQRPVAAGWIDGAQLDEDLPCDADGRMAVDGEGWKRWWQEFDAMPDFDDDGNISDPPPKPQTPPRAVALVEQHAALWSLLCNTDDPAQVWRRPEGAYLLFGWPVADVEVPGVPSIHMDLGFDEESGWADGFVFIEGVLCSVGGPVMRWQMKEQDWHPVDAGEEWIQKLRSAVPDPLALLPFTSQHQRVLAAVGPMSEGFAIPKKKIG